VRAVRASVVEQLLGGLAEQLIGRPAEHLRGGRVGEGDAPALVDVVDALAGELQDAVAVACEARQLDLGVGQRAPALGDVLHEAHPPQRPAVLVADDRHRELDPDVSTCQEAKHWVRSHNVTWSGISGGEGGGHSCGRSARLPQCSITKLRGTGWCVRAACEHVFVWVGVDSEADGGFAAGLIAGDGCFWIRPNNSGATWACGFSLGLRADDTPLLARLCRWSGVGQLSAVSARGNSKPQTTWTVRRQRDCLRLVSILDQHRLLGKKLGEYEIWREAVIAWTGGQSDRHALVARYADRLVAYRAPDHRPAHPWVAITEHHLLAFLAGFVTAEAHFGADRGGHPSLTINLRSDDGELLRFFRERLDIGRVVDVPPYGTSRAAVSWRIGRLAELRSLTRHLDRYPPRGRVLRIYTAWRELVLLQDRRFGARRELAARVRQARAYKPGLETIVQVDRLEARRARHLAVLRSWAAATEGPHTATSYEAWRTSSRREAPTRNTIVAAFGSWIAAMEAAALSVRGCRSRSTNAVVQRAGAAGRLARQARLRMLTLAAVRECALTLGHLPSATEFFRWRHRGARDVPSQMTIYRTFPGGWRSVLDSLGDDPYSPSAADPLEPAAQPVHVGAAACEELAVEPDVEAGSADQLGHEGVAGHEVAARQRE
jgi:hypothetical protein